MQTISGATVCALARTCPRLRKLSLARCLNITDKCLFELANPLHSVCLDALTVVNMTATNVLATLAFKFFLFSNYHYNIQVTDIGVCYLLSNCLRLEKIDVAYCVGITDKTVDHILDLNERTHCFALSLVCLRFGTRVTPEAIHRLRNTMKHLRLN